MANALPISVSSRNVSSMTTLSVELNPFANEGITAETAPVLLSLESSDVVNAEQFAAMMPVVGGQGTEAQARLVVNSIAEVIRDLVEEHGAITVNTPFGTVRTFIAGTVENPTDQPDPEKNYAYLGVVVPEVYRRQFANIETYIPAAACPAALKRVRDRATGDNTIHGTAPFYIGGRGMTIGGEGETLELLSGDTYEKIVDIAVDESKSNVSLVCHLPDSVAVAAGNYILRMTTLAGGDAGLWPLDLKVTVSEPITPEMKPRVRITSFRVEIPSGEGSSAEVQLFGENFAGVDGYSHNEGEPEFMNAKFYVNGSEDGNEMMLEDGRTMLHGVSVGDTVKVVLDVTSPDYDPTPAEATATVAG